MYLERCFIECARNPQSDPTWRQCDCLRRCAHAQSFTFPLVLLSGTSENGLRQAKKSNNCPWASGSNILILCAGNHYYVTGQVDFTKHLYSRQVQRSAHARAHVYANIAGDHFQNVNFYSQQDGTRLDGSWRRTT